MYPLDCVSDDILLKWFNCLREKTITRAIQWTVTRDAISVPMGDRHIFKIARCDTDTYIISIGIPYQSGSAHWITLINNKNKRETRFLHVRTFEDDIRRYVFSLDEWKETLSEFHSLVTS